MMGMVVDGAEEFLKFGGPKLKISGLRDRLGQSAEGVGAPRPNQSVDFMAGQVRRRILAGPIGSA
jgi:hypothetical protein